MGKSRSLLAEVEKMKIARPETDRGSIVVDLGPVSSRGDLRDKIKGNSEVITWMAGTGTIHLCLDSLDEALPFYHGLPKELMELIKELPKERMFLSVACRTGQFPQYLEEELQLLFGEGAVNILHLAPLRCKDIHLATNQNGLEAERFVREVSDAGIEALAARPVTLEVLMELFGQQSELPKDVWSLYERGCRYLLSEHPGSSRFQLLPSVPLEKKVAVAARIGCLTIFGAYSAIDAGISNNPRERNVLMSGDLLGGQERATGNRFDVNGPEIAGVLKTGLFTASDSLFRWCHKSFSEFLAAYHLRANNVPISQVMQLLTCAGRVAPALHGVAAWLAQKNDALFREILTIDPEALFSSDLRVASDPHKEQLVQWLLKEAENESPLINEWWLSSSYSKLSHSRLSIQLAAVIEQSASVAARHLAIIIARACREGGLQNRLTDLALHDGEPVGLRTDAASYVAALGTERDKGKLLPLALENAPGDDQHERLKAAAFAAVWPRNCTWAQVQDALGCRDPKTTTSLGRFLAFDLPEDVPEAILPEALRWLAQLNPPIDGLSAWAIVTDKLLTRAAFLPDQPALQSVIADVLAARLLKHSTMLSISTVSATGFLPWPVNTRRNIAAQLVPRLAQNYAAALGTLRGAHPLLKRDDLEFVIGQWRIGSPNEKNIWQMIVGLLVDCQDEDTTGSIQENLRDYPELQDHVQRIQQNRHRDRELDRQARLRNDAADEQKVQQRLAQIRQLIADAASDTRKLEELLDWMSCELNDNGTFGVLQRRVSEFPGWKVLTVEEQECLLTAGQRFIESERPTVFRSLRAGECRWHAEHVGYAILRELMARRPTYIEQLATQIIEVWMPAVVLCQCWISNDKYGQADQTLLDLTIARSEGRLARIVGILVRRGRTLDLDRQLRRLERAPLSELFNARLLGAVLKSRSLSLYLTGMRMLLLRSYGPAIEAVKKIKAPPNMPANIVNRPALNAALWIEHDCKDAWTKVWALMQNDSSFARDVLDVCVGDEERKLIQYVAPSLTEQELRDLFLWLRKQFGAPPQFPSMNSGAEWATQHAILANLKKRGTPTSVTVLKEIEQQLPQGDEPSQIQARWDARRAIWEARRAYLDAAWAPLDFRAIMRIVEDKRQLLVRDQQELAEAVWLALEDYQKDIRDEGSRVMRLWDEGDYRPKPEEPISREIVDGLQSSLRDRGVQSTLETKLREGQFLDIYISATTSHLKNQTATVIVEVKGCWNRELKTAQETQLAMRYLKDRSSKDGIYLVAWFLCDKWDAQDPRKEQTPKWEISTAKIFLSQQAAEINSNTGSSIRPFVLDATIEGAARSQTRKFKKALYQK
jgi:hypothetical protein